MPINVFEAAIDPASGESFRCISITPEAYQIEWIVQPKGYVPFEHIHLNQDEIFEIKEGEVRLLMDGKEYIAKAGDTIVVPKGIKHIAFNNRDAILRCFVTYSPALDMQTFSQCFNGMVEDRHYDKNGKINIPMMGYFLTKMKCQAMTRPTEIPAFAFGSALRAFYLFGLLKGWSKLYFKYTGLS